MPKASERATKLASEVLAKIAGYDPYFPKPNPSTLAAWAEHISLKNPDRDDMLAAVSKFYETTTDVKPLPASITSIARTIRQDSLLHGEYEPPPDKSDDPEPEPDPGAKKISMAEWEALHGVQFPKLALGRPLEVPDEGLDGPNPLRVQCPYCRAGPGSPCTVDRQPLRLVRAHESRCAIVEKRCGGLHHESPHTERCAKA